MKFVKISKSFRRLVLAYFIEMQFLTFIVDFPNIPWSFRKIFGDFSRKLPKQKWLQRAASDESKSIKLNLVQKLAPNLPNKMCKFSLWLLCSWFPITGCFMPPPLFRGVLKQLVMLGDVAIQDSLVEWRQQQQRCNSKAMHQVPPPPEEKPVSNQP